MTDEPAPTRRRRRRAVWRSGVGITNPEQATAATLAPGDADAAPTEPTAAPAPGVKRRRGDPSERGLRDLVGAGPSQLGPTRAMRARDLNRPTEADLAAAEQDLVIVRRRWKPPAP
jgi:hypothetical protein